MIPEQYILDKIYEYSLDRAKGDRLIARETYNEIVRYVKVYSERMSDVPLNRATPEYCLGEICFSTKKRLQHFKSWYSRLSLFLYDELPYAKSIPVPEVRYVIFDIIFCCFLYDDVKYARVHLNNTIRVPKSGEAARVFAEPIDIWARRVADDYWFTESDRDCKARNAEFDASECLEEEIFDLYTGHIADDGTGEFYKASVSDMSEFIGGVRIRDVWSMQ